MNSSRIIVWVCCMFSWSRLLHAGHADGYVIEWGWNTAAGVAQPARTVCSNVAAISAGASHSLALMADGTVFGWGGNYLGEATGMPSTNNPYTSAGMVIIGRQPLSNVLSIVASREFSLALRTDGTVVTWGRNYVPKGMTNVAAVAADETHSWVLKRSGTVLGWWRELSPSFGPLAAGSLSNVAAISVGPGPQGGTRGVALFRNGTVGHWGSESIYKEFTTPPAGLSNVVAVAAGAGHSLALKKDGTVVGWGDNSYGQATGALTTDTPNIAAGQVSIGGQVLTNVVSIAASREYSLALKKDGTMLSWGRPRLFDVTVPVGMSNVTAIAAGRDFCLAITTNPAVAARFMPKK